MLRLPYGKDFVGDIRLLDPTTGEFMASAPTIAAGDLTVHHNRLAPANPTGKTVTFTSGGTYEVKPGDTVTGATSAATAIVMGVRLTSGTWAGGDAAGELFVRSDSGTFQAENLDVGATTNVATIDAALDAAGLFRYLVGKRFAFGVPGTQLQGARGAFDVIDATATEEWEDTSIPFETYDHPLAADPAGCLFAGTATAVAAGTITLENLDDGYVRPLSADATAVAGMILYIDSATTGAGQAVAISSYVHATRVVTLLHNFSLTPTGTIAYKIYANTTRTPTHVLNMAANALSQALNTDTLTESYAADNAAATPAQLLYLILAMLTEKAVSGTTVTAKKLDGSTTAATFTLSDASNPTSITRAT